MYVEEIMTSKVVTVELDHTLTEVRAIFQNAPFHHLLVLDEEKLQGIVSDRDYMKALSPFVSTMAERSMDRSTLKQKVHQFMSRKLITVVPETPIPEAARLLVQNNVTCLPVVASDQKVCGIVTWKDILKWMIRQQDQVAD